MEAIDTANAQATSAPVSGTMTTELAPPVKAEPPVKVKKGKAPKKAPKRSLGVELLQSLTGKLEHARQQHLGDKHTITVKGKDGKKYDKEAVYGAEVVSVPRAKDFGEDVSAKEKASIIAAVGHKLKKGARIMNAVADNDEDVIVSRISVTETSYQPTYKHIKREDIAMKMSKLSGIPYNQMRKLVDKYGPKAAIEVAKA